jgi:hypothetical protein
MSKSPLSNLEPIILNRRNPCIHGLSALERFKVQGVSLILYISYVYKDVLKIRYFNKEVETILNIMNRNPQTLVLPDVLAVQGFNFHLEPMLNR